MLNLIECTRCNILLDLAGIGMGNMALSHYLMSEPLVTIALALQDRGMPHQSQGTALFERMLEFNVRMRATCCWI